MKQRDKIGKKLMAADTKPHVVKKEQKKPQPEFEKAFQAYLGLNLEEQPELKTTDLYVEGLRSDEWKGGNYH